MTVSYGVKNDLKFQARKFHWPNNHVFTIPIPKSMQIIIACITLPINTTLLDSMIFIQILKWWGYNIYFSFLQMKLIFATWQFFRLDNIAPKYIGKVKGQEPLHKYTIWQALFPFLHNLALLDELSVPRCRGSCIRKIYSLENVIKVPSSLSFWHLVYG